MKHRCRRRSFLLRHVVGDFAESILGLSDVFVDAILMLDHEWPQDLVVDDVGSAVVARHHKPKKKNALRQSVERDPEEQLVAEELEDAEESIHAPVHQPFRVIVLVHRLDGFDRLIGWPEESDQVANEVVAPADHQVKGLESNDAVGDELAVHFRLLLDFAQQVRDDVVLVQSLPETLAHIGQCQWWVG